MQHLLLYAISILLFCGFIISCYATYIILRKKHDTLYTPLCDISSKVSCTIVLQSSFGRLFGISNAYLGMAFNVIMGLLLIYEKYATMFLLASGALLLSIYLAYTLLRMKKWCIVCLMTYVLHLTLFITTAIFFLHG